MSGPLVWNKKLMKREREVRRLRIKNRRTKNTKWSKAVHKEKIPRIYLENYYLRKHQSMQEIADTLRCSLHKVAYWMEKYKIKSRPRSEAMYVKYNPHGDPFRFQIPQTIEEAKLFGLGLGLYWGEGTKASQYAIRLGNADSQLIKKFIEFLAKFFNIKKEELQFGLQIFSDINSEIALDFWIKTLRIRRSQIYKPIITKSGSVGTYRHKSKYGVLTVMYHNKKLRELIGKLLPM